MCRAITIRREDRNRIVSYCPRWFTEIINKVVVRSQNNVSPCASRIDVAPIDENTGIDSTFRYHPSKLSAVRLSISITNVITEIPARLNVRTRWIPCSGQANVERHCFCFKRNVCVRFTITIYIITVNLLSNMYTSMYNV